MFVGLFVGPLVVRESLFEMRMWMLHFICVCIKQCVRIFEFPKVGSLKLSFCFLSVGYY